MALKSQLTAHPPFRLSPGFHPDCEARHSHVKRPQKKSARRRFVKVGGNETMNRTGESSSAASLATRESGKIRASFRAAMSAWRGS